MSDTNPDEPNSLINSLSTSGIAAQIPRQEMAPILIAPTTDNQLNTVRSALLPIACWSIGDARFEFGCSFVRPEIGDDVKAMIAMITRLEKKLGARPRLTIFGHTDPVGQQPFNKKLSGRRAAAIYAILTRRSEIWEDIYKNEGQFTAALAEDNWGSPALMIIFTDLGYTVSSDAPKETVKAFQNDESLPVDGVVGPVTRKRLFENYMDKHTRTRDGEQFQLSPGDFLAANDDQAGKGNYQGCGEANPLMIFSEEENKLFSDAEKKSDRDIENTPNRRVLVYLFAPDSHVDPDSWPCPRAKDGDKACKKRFWSNSDERISNQEKRREFQDTRDTFACRFYDRLASNSPCELTSIAGFAVYLLDPDRKRLPYAEWRILSVGEVIAKGIANEEALAIVTLPQIPPSISLEWRPATGENEQQDEDIYQYVRPHFPLAGEEDADDNFNQMLANLGYDILDNASATLKAFQADYGLEETGILDDIKKILREWHDTGEAPSIPSTSKEVFFDIDKMGRNR